MKKKQKAPAKVGKTLLNILMLVFSISCLFPIAWIFLSSMKSQSEFMLSSMSLPKAFHIENYIYVFQKTNMGLYLLNSVRNTFISVGIIIIISFLASYVIARYPMKGTKFAYQYFIVGMMVPIHALLVPIYIELKQAGLLNRWYTLLFPYVAFGLSMSILLMTSYVETIPRELEDAAAIDGCSFWKTMMYVIFPLTRPMMATVAIIQFFQIWNEFSFSLVLISKEALKTVPLGLNAFKGAHDVNYPRMMAAIMISMLPVMIMYFSLSRKIIDGMVAGAVKS